MRDIAKIGRNDVALAQAIESTDYLDRIWSRSRSQLVLRNIVCGQTHRAGRLRQIAAEMKSRKAALAEARHTYRARLAEAAVKEEEAGTLFGARRDLALIEAEKLREQAEMLRAPVEGAMKDIMQLSQMHDEITAGEPVTEAEIEREQIRANLERAFTQAARDVRMTGHISTGNQEYLEQLGVCPTAARSLVGEQIKRELRGDGTTAGLESWLKEMAERFAGSAEKRTQRLGYTPDVNLSICYGGDHENR